MKISRATVRGHVVIPPELRQKFNIVKPLPDEPVEASRGGEAWIVPMCSTAMPSLHISRMKTGPRHLEGCKGAENEGVSVRRQFR